METLVSAKELEKYYKDKKVFVTGHTGFKGSWLVALLHTFGATVKGYALAPEYENGLFNLLMPSGAGNSVIADIRNKEKLSREILLFEPDYIFHLAAQPLVRRSYIIPAETFEVNTVGTANLLEAVVSLTGKCTVVIVTTDKVYVNKEQNILYTEDQPLGGYDPYSASKACTELVVSSFRNSFFNIKNYVHHCKGIASARAGNVIGGGDWSTDRIIPDIVRSLQQHSAIEVRNPDAVRPWQHVLEPICGYLLLGAFLNDTPEQYARAYNFGPYLEDHLTVRDLVTSAINIWGQGSWTDVSNAQQPHEATLLKLDIGLAMNQLQWKPKLRAMEAIKWTIEWYRQPQHLQKEFTFQQIENYFSL